MLHIAFWSIFLLALLVTFVTDYYYLLIHRAATLFLIPLFLLGAFLCATPCNLLEALLGFFVGYGFLWCFKTFYLWHRNIDGIGQGDLELLAMIGTFLGPMGVLYTITFGSIIGTVIAVIMLLAKRAHAQTQLPFGSFLVVGCFIYVLIMLNYCPWLKNLLF